MQSPSCAAPPVRGPNDPARRWLQQQQARIWRYLRLLGASPDLADDLVQECFLRALDGRLRQVDEPVLRRVARNLFIDQCRRRARLRLEPWADAVDSLVQEEPQQLDDPALEPLRRCLQRLSPRARQALQLRHGDGLGQAEVGRLLGIRANGAKALLRRARGLLRQCMEEQR